MSKRQARRSRTRKPKPKKPKTQKTPESTKPLVAKVPDEETKSILEPPKPAPKEPTGEVRGEPLKQPPTWQSPEAAVQPPKSWWEKLLGL